MAAGAKTVRGFGGVVVAAAVAVGAGLGGCQEPARGQLAQSLVEEFNAVAEARATAFSFPEPSLGENQFLFSIRLAKGERRLATADLVTAISLVDACYPALAELGGKEELVIAAGARQTRAAWEGPDQDGEYRLASVAGLSTPYDDSFCALASITTLASPGRGSDFGDIARCNPDLESLEVDGWEYSTGHEGLSGLRHLKTLHINRPWDSGRPTGTVANLDSLPAIDSLERLTLTLADDSDQNRAAVEAKYPTCAVEFNPRQDSVGFVSPEDQSDGGG
ncbi:MAG: hypothetical protein LBD70_07985 [Bifidobacteriaceae bacterium]|jgi:hypothetical protein|nr:hypothetical protein [Bifidobacteriaceae bacterium]